MKNRAPHSCPKLLVMASFLQTERRAPAFCCLESHYTPPQGLERSFMSLGKAPTRLHGPYPPCLYAHITEWWSGGWGQSFVAKHPSTDDFLVPDSDIEIYVACQLCASSGISGIKHAGLTMMAWTAKLKFKGNSFERLYQNIKVVDLRMQCHRRTKLRNIQVYLMQEGNPTKHSWIHKWFKDNLKLFFDQNWFQRFFLLFWLKHSTIKLTNEKGA